MNALALPTTTTTPTPAPNPAPGTERLARANDHLALRRLADEVQRLDRRLHRERSYASPRYAR